MSFPHSNPPEKANYVNTFKQTFFFLDGNEKTAKMTVFMLDMSPNHSVKSRVSGSQRQGAKHYNNHQTHTHTHTAEIFRQPATPQHLY